MSLSESTKRNAALTIKMFAESHTVVLDYDEKSIQFLDDFINQSGSKYNENQQSQLADFFGSFLGECIRKIYGGNWEFINGDPAIRFDEKNAVFPFNKVEKQFRNGAEDSILSFYQVVPIVFKINK